MDVALLRASFETILERERGLVAKFYGHLFAEHPELRRLFVGERVHQEQMFARALVALVDRFDDAPWVDQQLSALGRRHARYGITGEMYAWFCKALVRTLAEVSGADWTPKHESAWTEAFGEIARVMQKAADAELHKPTMQRPT